MPLFGMRNQESAVLIQGLQANKSPLLWVTSSASEVPYSLQTKVSEDFSSVPLQRETLTYSGIKW